MTHEMAVWGISWTLQYGIWWGQEALPEFFAVCVWWPAGRAAAGPTHFGGQLTIAPSDNTLEGQRGLCSHFETVCLVTRVPLTTG